MARSRRAARSPRLEPSDRYTVVRREMVAQGGRAARRLDAHGGWVSGAGGRARALSGGDLSRRPRGPVVE